jgi:serine/threonine-protein kinase
MKCEACGHENIDGARFCASCGVLQPVQTTSDDPMVGKTVGGRFRITGVLGEGGMGIVYVGEQQMGSTVRKVAIKTLHLHLSKDPSVIARFHRECGTVAQLEHPNTIKFYDFGTTDDGALYIAMEFVDGRSLSKVIEEEGALAPDRAIKIMRQVCGALDEAHNTGVIHRDLKPENIVLGVRAGETDFVKVLDFGIAARTESADASKEQKLTQQGMVLGTPPYMSPEQFTGKALDARSDIYSLGVMVYEMLTGRLPFEADTPWQWATQHMTVQPMPFEVSAPSRSIPDSMRQAILRSLSKDREQRQESARQFFAQLAEGERMTVEQPARAGATGTAQMEAAPDFATMAAPAVPMMAAPAAAPMHAPVAAVPPVAPPTAAKSGGGKGLVFGLAGLGAVLLVAIVVVLARSGKSDEGGPITLTSTPAQSSSPNTGTLVPEGPEPTQTADPGLYQPPPDQPAAKTPTTPKGGTAKGTGGTSGGTAATGTGGAKSGGTGGTTTTTPPAGGGEACQACTAAARSGDIQGSLTKYRACNDSAGQAACSRAARSPAAAAARTAALNGQCPQAKAIQAAANQMGAGSPALDKSVRENCP